MSSRNKRARATSINTSRVVSVHEAGADGQATVTVAATMPPPDMSIHRPVVELFLAAFGSTIHRLTFKPSWHNGTGYFDAAVHDEDVLRQLPLGERGSFVDDQGRKALVLHTSFGLVMVFERYNDGPVPLVCNYDDRLRSLSPFDEHVGAMKLHHVQDLLLLTQLSVYHARVQAHLNGETAAA